MAECHIGCEKLLSSLFKFRANNVLKSTTTESIELDEAAARRR